MAFQFIPPFNEGDKQTNPETGVEYLFTSGAWRPLGPKIEDEFDTLDERYLRLTGGTLESSLKIQRGADKTHAQYKISPNGGTDYATNVYSYEGQMRFRTSHTEADGDAKGSHIVLDPDVAGDGANPVTKIWKVVTPTSGDMAANRDYVDDAIDEYKDDVDEALNEYMKLNGRQTTGGELKLDNGGKSYIHIQTNNTLGLYNLQEPEESHHAATRKYVDEQIAASPSGGVPVGSIMIWMNSTAPAGWFKLQGGTFDTTANPLLHAYLQNTEGYTAGRLPNWSGRYPGEYGDHITDPLGSFKNYRTAKPINDFVTDNPGNHTHRYGNNAYGGGATNTAHDSRNQSKYVSDGAGAHTHRITSGGDSTTRPRTVVVHYIIKHD